MQQNISFQDSLIFKISGETLLPKCPDFFKNLKSNNCARKRIQAFSYDV